MSGALDIGSMDRRGIALRVGGLVFVAGLVALGVAFLPFMAGVRERLTDARPGWIGATALLQLASDLSFVAAFRGVFGRGLPWSLTYHTAMVEQGANVLLPTGGAGGLALGAVALERAGLERSCVARRSVALFLLTSAASLSTLAVAGAVCMIGIASGGIHLSLALVPAVLGVVGLVGVALAPKVLPQPEPHGGRVRRLAGTIGATLHTGVAEALTLLRRRDPLLIGGALGYLWFDIASLGAAFQAFGGGGPALGAFVLAYILGQLGALIPIPGGIGGTDGGLIGFLILYGATGSAAAAGVLAFRVFQLGFPTMLGAVALGRLSGDVRRAAAIERPRQPAAQ